MSGSCFPTLAAQGWGTCNIWNDDENRLCRLFLLLRRQILLYEFQYSYHEVLSDQG
jgi:hypothetical protein